MRPHPRPDLLLPTGRRALRLAALLSLTTGLLLASGCSLVTRPTPPPPFPERGQSESGIASWYGPGFHGRTTANGETYDMEAMTAAHRTLAFNTVVRVDNLDNGRSIQVRINDRGPFVDGRIIDLSRRAARELDMLGAGIAQVRVTVVQTP
jgi:rare lipoprotein A